MNDVSSAWRLQSPAKINWTLQVLGRRADGFHLLQSWFVAVGLFDTLAVGIASDTHGAGLSVVGEMSQGVPSDQRNLVLQAEALWRQMGGVVPNLAWCLDKKIPAAAGLGGGSGNAAAALLLLQKLSTQQPQATLQELALTLGSDVPYFLQSQSACLMGGQGEQLLASDVAPKRYIVLAMPDFVVPTKSVFSALESTDWSQDGPSRQTKFPSRPGVNDLLAAACRAVPRLQGFRTALQRIGRFHLSGSGGTFFCSNLEQQSAQEIAVLAREVCQYVCVVPLLTGPVISAFNPLEEA